jgi:hypothetical protein
LHWNAGVHTHRTKRAGYLTWSKLANVSVACSASGGGSCSTILESNYAEILGVPLPALGALGYASVAALSLYSLLLKSGNGDAEPDASACRQLATNGKLVLYGAPPVHVSRPAVLGVHASHACTGVSAVLQGWHMTACSTGPRTYAPCFQ